MGLPDRYHVGRSWSSADLHAISGDIRADRERVFDRFFRLDDARAPGGAGLGLPIARMVARLHEGNLEVGESALGGAAFRLVLPRASRATLDK
jgi:signal transduction histidine kinase